MGMFDTVEVHRKLQLKANDEVSSKDVAALNKKFSWKEIEFQTKSLDSCMEHFKIAVNGKLYVQRQKYKEAEPKKKQRGKNAKNVWSDFPFLELDGDTWFEPAPRIPTSLQFYTSLKLRKDKEYWLEFEAIFLEGKLYEIKQIALEEIKPQEYTETQPVSEKPSRKLFKKIIQFQRNFIQWQQKVLLGNKW